MKIEDAKNRVCPLMKNYCKANGCMWWHETKKNEEGFCEIPIQGPWSC